MLFTRTIQRTMVCGLAMVLLMMIGLSLSAIYSHLSYRNIIRRLDDAFSECPRKAELVEATLKLEVALRPGLNKPEVLEHVRPDFQTAIVDAEAIADDFLDKIDRLPPYPEFQQAKPISDAWARNLQAGLKELEQRSRKLNATSSPDELDSIVKQIDRLQELAQLIPDFQRGIPATLENARTVFRRGFWLVSAAGVSAVLLFCGVIVYGYLWVFSPLRELHRGALRVAQGDFNYRLRHSRQDEMKELADAFNSMTSRFQEIACDLDRQVCERSKQLVRSERLAGIGFLAAGVAHEINNPLSAIAMAAESLTDRLAEDPAGISGENGQVVRQYLHMIQREAFRCQRITRKLLDFARGNDESRVRHDLASIVNDVLGVIRHMNRYDDRRIIFRRTTPCVLEINGPEIQQVVLNLVSNALEAMDSGGTMKIDITDQTDQVTLSVIDDGCGMSPEVIENLFEPFFTQRRNGRGTGLGLSISHRIVNDHGGTIEVKSDGPGQGSVFQVRLPKRTLLREVAA